MLTILTTLTILTGHLSPYLRDKLFPNEGLPVATRYSPIAHRIRFSGFQVFGYLGIWVPAPPITHHPSPIAREAMIPFSPFVFREIVSPLRGCRR